MLTSGEHVPKTLAEQIAELEDPTPRDIDPEELENAIFGHDDDADATSGDDREQSEVNGRAHYIDVGKSKLRKPGQPFLGPRYSGATISRRAVAYGDQESELNEPDVEQTTEEIGSEEEDDPEVDHLYADPNDVEKDVNMGEVDYDEEIDSEEAFGEGDDKAFASFTFRGSGKPKDEKTVMNGKLDKPAEGDVGSGDDTSEQEYSGLPEGIINAGSTVADVTSEDGMSLDGHGANDDSGSDDGDDSFISSSRHQDSRAALRKMMATQTATVAASISQATKSDIAKGHAVQRQRSSYDTLLNTRIRLQKALIASNTIPTLPLPSSSDPITTEADPVLAAETAALELFNTMTSLRIFLPSFQSHGKSEASLLQPASSSTPLSTLQATLSTLDKGTLPHHRTILSKWSQKTQPATALSTRNKLTNISSQQTLLILLDAQLAGPGMEHLIAKTKIPRSCAPVQAQREGGKVARKDGQAPASANTEQADIYDDADFYASLLRELVERKMGDPTTHQSAANGLSDGAGAPDRSALGDGLSLQRLSKEARVKKKVDTKASKGRKMRYTVHEKLQNFMAREDRGEWGGRQIDEFFGGLLGSKIRLGEDEGGGDGESVGEEDGLRLFGGR